MKIEKVNLKNFMIFDTYEMTFSPQINVIFGENSTGKSTLLKVLYSTMKSLYDIRNGRGDFTAEKYEKALISKLNGVFMPDEDTIGRLVGRQQGSNRAEVELILNSMDKISYGFGNRQTNHLALIINTKIQIDDYVPIYIPPKEIISSTANFTSLYDDYHIAIEETYYDLSRLLLRPLKKGPNTNQQKRILDSYSGIMNGNVIQRDNKFYLKVKGAGEFEMGLVSEGYRKLSTITYLILSGSLNNNAILFWDEPESNMNPKMIKSVVESLIVLAKMGVQIFVTTHSYFVQQCFNLIASYPKANKDHVDIQFVSLFKEQEKKQSIQYETGKTLSDIQINPIIEEFDHVYEREQEMME